MIDNTKKCSQPLCSQSGQAVTEYFVLLSVTIVFVMILLNQFIKPVYGKLLTIMTRQIDQRMNQANLHYFKVSQ